MKDFSDEFLLFLRCRLQLEGVVDLVHAFAGRNVFCIAADAFAIHRTNVFELGDQLCHSYLSSLPLRGVLEPKGAVEPLDLLHTFTAQSFQ